MLAKNARRRSLEFAQLCACCTTQQLADEFYAWNGGGAEVDHIVALKAAELLGLKGAHCRKNLRLYTTADHKAKTRLDGRLIRQLKRQPALRLQMTWAHYCEHEPRAAEFLEAFAPSFCALAA